MPDHLTSSTLGRLRPLTRADGRAVGWADLGQMDPDRRGGGVLAFRSGPAAGADGLASSRGRLHPDRLRLVVGVVGADGRSGGDDTGRADVADHTCRACSARPSLRWSSQQPCRGALGWLTSGCGSSGFGSAGSGTRCWPSRPELGRAPSRCRACWVGAGRRPSCPRTPVPPRCRGSFWSCSCSSSTGSGRRSAGEGSWSSDGHPVGACCARPCCRSAVWVPWHLPLFWVSESFRSFGPGGAAGWLVSITAGSVVLTWMYLGSGGSIWIAAPVAHHVQPGTPPKPARTWLPRC